MHDTTQSRLQSTAEQHGFSIDAVRMVAQSLSASGGTMAQFNHPELGGAGQWMNGMTMIGDMFNDGLKARVAALCRDLSGTAKHMSFAQQAFQGFWWDPSLGTPSQSASQDGLRYAYFPDKHRFVAEIAGALATYDTTGIVITGIGQQSSGGLRLTTDRGVIALSDLKRL
jgi:hypothetical protein